jgi:hypothetical protein
MPSRGISSRPTHSPKSRLVITEPSPLRTVATVGSVGVLAREVW